MNNLTLISDITLQIGLGVFLIIAVIWVMKMTLDKNVQFDAMHLLMEKNSDGTWRESRKALGEMIAVIVSTWGFIFLTASGKLTEWYMGAWMTILLGWSILKNITSKPSAGDPISPQSDTQLDTKVVDTEGKN